VLAGGDDLIQAAANLFASLRRLDAGGYQRIYAVAVPERGIGRAIMDRLRRASRQ
jgi:L-threonylcarbamoyladenylate synthase